MVSRHRKLVARSDPSCIDISMLLEPVLAILPSLLHLAIAYHNGKVCCYLQNTEHISRANVAKLIELFEKHAGNTSIEPYSKVEGELQQEWQSQIRRGKKPRTKTDTIEIFVNPIGQESLQHITQEYVANLLKQALNIGVFFKFGLKLYSLEQNMNFRARKSYSLVRVRTNDKWITVSKEKAYDEILLVLVRKTQEAVEMYKDSIPTFDLKHFNMFLPVVSEHKHSPVLRLKNLYKNDRNQGLNTIAISVNNRLNLLHRWGGKKIKLM